MNKGYLRHVFISRGRQFQATQNATKWKVTFPAFHLSYLTLIPGGVDIWDEKV